MFNEHLKMMGLNVTDKVTGKKGVVTLITFDLFGCIQGAVSSTADKDGVIPNSVWYDINRLKPGKTAFAVKYPITVPLHTLGRAAEDKGTKLKGIVTSVTVDVDGSIELLITPKLDKNDKRPEAHYANIMRVEVTGEPVMQQPDFVEGPVAEAKKGPADKPAMNRV